MDKLSAVNHAKTRRGKARALNAATKPKTRLLMESVTIPLLPCRALKRSAPMEPVKPPLPTTPIGVDEKSPSTKPKSAPANGAKLAVLRKGWKIIERYLADEVGADVVSDYLATVDDPVSKSELDKGFSSAMGCEDDEAQEIVQAMIQEKLNQFGSLTPCPHAASQTYLPSRVNFGASSIPPSSPCPNNFAASLAGALNRAEELEAEEMEAGCPAPSAAVPHVDNSTDKKDTKSKAARRRARKWKNKAPASADEQDDHKSDEEECPVKKAGWLSKETIEQAHTLQQTYHNELEVLALKEGKSVVVLLAAVSNMVLDNRALNPWNTFQAYATHPNGLAMERAEDQTIPEFNAQILADYRSKRAEAEDEDDNALAPIMEWYQQQLDNQTAKLRMEGFTIKQLQKIVKPFNARGRQAYKFYGVSVFGFVVDSVGRRALEFGADPLYLAMKDSNAANLPGQLADYGALIHVELMKRKGIQYLDPAKEAIVRKFHSAGSDHEALQTILKDIWLQNLNEVAPRSGHIKQLQWGLHFADLCDTHKVKLVNYPIGLLPLGVPNGLQGVAKMNIARYIKPRVVKDFVQYWQQEAEAKKAELAGDHQYAWPLYSDDNNYDTRKNRVFQQDLVRFVPWNEDKLKMDIAEQAHIGIVLQEPQGNGKPLVLAKVLHSKKFLAKATAHKVEIKHGQDGQDSSDDEGDGSEDESEHDHAH